MKHFVLCLVTVQIVSALSGCQVMSNFIPTQTPYPTYTPHPTYTPNPTFTPFPTLTSTPSPTAVSVLFEANEFDNVNSCFPVDSFSDVRRFSEDGQYHIVVQKKIYFGWSVCEKDLRNFVIEVDATPIEGPSNNSYAYGLLFRRDDDTEGFYTFLISADGYYTFSGVYPDNYYSLLSWTSIREIKQGKQTNHLKAIVFGEQFELYVNDVLVGLVREGTLKSGSFGFIVETFDDANVQVAFDNLVITSP
jgi:hypothetical protein